MKRKRNVNVQVLPIVKEDSINVSKEIARYLLDISKLVIGGSVITTALDLTSNKTILINISLGAAIIFASLGLTILFKTYKRKGNKL